MLLQIPEKFGILNIYKKTNEKKSAKKIGNEKDLA